MLCITSISAQENVEKLLSEGVLVEDSFNANGQNLGCPASEEEEEEEEEVAVFIKNSNKLLQ
jgi:hypothetical protein